MSLANHITVWPSSLLPYHWCCLRADTRGECLARRQHRAASQLWARGKCLTTARGPGLWWPLHQRRPCWQKILGQCGWGTQGTWWQWKHLGRWDAENCAKSKCSHCQCSILWSDFGLEAAYRPWKWLVAGWQGCPVTSWGACQKVAQASSEHHFS